MLAKRLKRGISGWSVAGILSLMIAISMGVLFFGGDLIRSTSAQGEFELAQERFVAIAGTLNGRLSIKGFSTYTVVNCWHGNLIVQSLPAYVTLENTYGVKIFDYPYTVEYPVYIAGMLASPKTYLGSSISRLEVTPLLGEMKPVVTSSIAGVYAGFDENINRYYVQVHPARVKIIKSTIDNTNHYAIMVVDVDAREISITSTRLKVEFTVESVDLYTFTVSNGPWNLKVKIGDLEDTYTFYDGDTITLIISHVTLNIEPMKQFPW